MKKHHKNVFIYELDGLSEDKLIAGIRDFYSSNYNEPREISLTPQAYNAVFPYHKQQVKSVRGVDLKITNDRISPLVVIS